MSPTEREVEQIMLHPWLYVGLPPREQGALRLSAWSNFSLGVWSSWSVFADRASFFVRRIEWARSLDRIRIATEAPSTFGSESPLAALLAEDLLVHARELLAAKSPPQPSGIVIDGVSRRLLVQEVNCSASSVTWQAGSPRAQHLDAWLEDASVALDNQLTASSARGVSGAA